VRKGNRSLLQEKISRNFKFPQIDLIRRSILDKRICIFSRSAKNRDLTERIWSRCTKYQATRLKIIPNCGARGGGMENGATIQAGEQALVALILCLLVLPLDTFGDHLSN
jgi:hypothetical protein